jgi:hypothetical protein
VRLSGGRVSWESLPLRIPPDLQLHVEKTLEKKNRVKRNGRKNRQITPGVYSCGHEVIILVIPNASLTLL